MTTKVTSRVAIPGKPIVMLVSSTLSISTTMPSYHL
jgi:hypothetical protein